MIASANILDNVTIRPVSESDLGEIMVIEGACFHSPWTRQNFVEEFRNSDLSIPLGIEYDKKIIAYAFIWILLDECHLANIAVHPDFRRMGLAKLLIDKIIVIARDRGCAKIMLEVRKSNREAIELYVKYGFFKVGVRKNYYNDGFLRTEDAILMDLIITKEDKG